MQPPMTAKWLTPRWSRRASWSAAYDGQPSAAVMGAVDEPALRWSISITVKSPDSSAAGSIQTGAKEGSDGRKRQKRASDLMPPGAHSRRAGPAPVVSYWIVTGPISRMGITRQYRSGASPAPRDPRRGEAEARKEAWRPLASIPETPAVGVITRSEACLHRLARRPLAKESCQARADLCQPALELLRDRQRQLGSHLPISATRIAGGLLMA